MLPVRETTEETSYNTAVATDNQWEQVNSIPVKLAPIRKCKVLFNRQGKSGAGSTFYFHKGDGGKSPFMQNQNQKPHTLTPRIIKKFTL